MVLFIITPQMLPRGHPMDMLDYVELTCSNNDSFTHSDTHTSIADTITHPPHPHHAMIESSSALIYPTHLDPSGQLPRKTRYTIEHLSRERAKEAMYHRERFEKSSSSSEDSPTSWFPSLPPPPLPVLPPPSPSPPAMFRQRMYWRSQGRATASLNISLGSMAKQGQIQDFPVKWERGAKVYGCTAYITSAKRTVPYGWGSRARIRALEAPGFTCFYFGAFWYKTG